MIASQRKKGLHLTVGLLFVLVLGLLLVFVLVPPQPAVIARKIALPGPGEAHAADVGLPALVRKKLPAPAPPPPAEPIPTPTAPAIESSAAGEEKPPEAAPVAPPPPATAALPELSPAPTPPPAPAAKLEAPKAEPKPISVARAAHPYSILLSSCREKDNALAALSDYRQKGLAPYIAQTELSGKGQWWRTLMGHYRTLAEATQARNALKIADAVVVKTPYANLIGQYESEAAAAATAARAAQQGVFAYIVRGPANSFQLMTGAFPSQQAAETHRRELEAKGLPTRIVQR